METFSDSEIISAIKAFLDYGEQTFSPAKEVGDGIGHGGYFSGSGFAARALRYHYEQLQKEQK